VNWKILLASFLEKFRKLSEHPLEKLAEIGLREGMTFLDVGCTLGFYSIPAASIVKEKGLVYALDISSDFTEYTSNKAMKKGIKNIRTITADAQNTGLSPETVDVVFLHLVLHDIQDRRKAIEEFNRVLKANGKLVIDEEKIMPPDFIRKLAEESGFRSSRTVGKTVQVFEKTRD